MTKMHEHFYGSVSKTLASTSCHKHFTWFSMHIPQEQYTYNKVTQNSQLLIILHHYVHVFVLILLKSGNCLQISFSPSYNRNSFEVI